MGHGLLCRTRHQAQALLRRARLKLRRLAKGDRLPLRHRGFRARLQLQALVAGPGQELRCHGPQDARRDLHHAAGRTALPGSLLANGPMLDLDPAHGKVTRIPSSEHSSGGVGRCCDQGSPLAKMCSLGQRAGAAIHQPAGLPLARSARRGGHRRAALPLRSPADAGPG